MTPTIYIAAPFPLQSTGVHVRRLLEEVGFKVQSRWLDEPDGSADKTDDEYLRERAVIDEEDLKQADGLLVINPIDWTHRGTGGRHVETGMAIALGIPIFVLGVRANVFHWHKAIIAAINDETMIVRLLQDWFRPGISRTISSE